MKKTEREEKDQRIFSINKKFSAVNKKCVQDIKHPTPNLQKLVQIIQISEDSSDRTSIHIMKQLSKGLKKINLIPISKYFKENLLRRLKSKI